MQNISARPIRAHDVVRGRILARLLPEDEPTVRRLAARYQRPIGQVIALLVHSALSSASGGRLRIEGLEWEMEV